MRRRTHDEFGTAAFVRRLRGSTDWRTQQEEVARLVYDDLSSAAVVMSALQASLADHGWDLAVDAMRKHVLGLVQRHPSPEATPLAVRLSGAMPTFGPARVDAMRARDVAASTLVGLRPIDELHHLLDDAEGLRLSDPEFGLLIVHEMAIRHMVWSPSFEWFSGWATRSGHELAAMPTRLADVERGFDKLLPSYGTVPGASGFSIPDANPPEPVTLGDLLSGVGARVVVDLDGIVGVVQGSLDCSNGRASVSGWELGTGFPLDADAPRMRADVEAAVIPFSTGLEMLFGAAHHGGAYGGGLGAGRARERAWRSVATILGAAATVPIEELSSIASGARWIQVAPGDPWFDQVAWDLWIVVEHRGRVVTFAATDTD